MATPLRIEWRSPVYLRSACDYVHLNPVRAGIVRSGQKLDKFRWSSYPAYLQPKLRPVWLRLDRLLGEHGLEKDTARSRREFERRMKLARVEHGENESVRHGWRIGAEDFHDWLADKLARRGRKGERPGSDRKQTRLWRRRWCSKRWRKHVGGRSI